LLEGMVAAPDQRIADLPLIGEEERQQLLFDWNAAPIGVRSQESEGATHASPVLRRESSDSWLLACESSCVHELFAAQAARTPDAIALVFDDHRPPTTDHRPTIRTQHATRNTQH